MSELTVLTLARETMQTALLVAAPLLLAALVVGIGVSLLQVATSIQDTTLVLIPKLVAVAVAFLIAFHWMLRVMLRFTVHLLGDFTPFLGA